MNWSRNYFHVILTDRYTTTYIFYVHLKKQGGDPLLVNEQLYFLHIVFMQYCKAILHQRNCVSIVMTQK